MTHNPGYNAKKHPVCTQFKEKNLTMIFQMIEQPSSSPPATKIVHAYQSTVRERQDIRIKRKLNATSNWIAVKNLVALNRAVKDSWDDARPGLGSQRAPGVLKLDEVGIYDGGGHADYYIALGGGNVFIGDTFNLFDGFPVSRLILRREHSFPADRRSTSRRRQCALPVSPAKKERQGSIRSFYVREAI
jgi:hypothetical protein